MSTGTDGKDDDDLALAGEYVLRVLSPEQQAAFEARLAVEPALARLVAQWEADLAPLAEDSAPMTPPPAVYRQIEARLFPAPQQARRGWRLWGGALAGLAMLGAVAFVALDRAAGPEPVFTATLASEGANLVVEARVMTDAAGVLQVTRLTGGPRDGRALELWLIADGASAPVSLGVVDAPMVEIALGTDLLAVLAGGVLAISDEPAGGSPTGAPTGEVLALAEISTL